MSSQSSYYQTAVPIKPANQKKETQSLLNYQKPCNTNFLQKFVNIKTFVQNSLSNDGNDGAHHQLFSNHFGCHRVRVFSMVQFSSRKQVDKADKCRRTSRVWKFT